MTSPPFTFAVLLLAGVIGAVTFFAGPDKAEGHTGATGIVKERMDLMQVLATANKRIRKALVAPGAPTASGRQSIATNATVIEKHAIKMLKMFPRGSNTHPSEALPSIWKKWPGFEKSAKALSATAANLKRLALTADRKLLLGAFAGMARNCGGCHAQYRLKKR